MSKWLKGLTLGLLHNGGNPYFLGHCYERVWPFGRLLPGSSKDFDKVHTGKRVRYLNLPFIRFKNLQSGYSKGVLSLAELNNSVIITYNPSSWHVAAAHKAQKMGAKWINLVLDYNFNDLGENWKLFTDSYSAADAHVFLSWWAFNECPLTPKYHLDSGLLETRFSNQFSGNSHKVLYAGKINRRGGSVILAQMIKANNDPSLKFIIAGKGHCEYLTTISKSDNRVKLLGFVNDEELDVLHREADIFINPRDPEHPENRMIFPSKILEYLSYGKPVVSTHTAGISPEYKDFLLFAEPNNYHGLNIKLKTAIALSTEGIDAYRDKLKQFLVQKSWSNQASKLLEIANSL